MLWKANSLIQHLNSVHTNPISYNNNHYAKYNFIEKLASNKRPAHKPKVYFKDCPKKLIDQNKYQSSYLTGK